MVAVCATIWTLVGKQRERIRAHVTKVCHKFVSAVREVVKSDNSQSSVRQRSAFVLGGNDTSSDERVMRTIWDRRPIV